MNIEPIEKDLLPYLESSGVIDWHQKSVQQKSREICEGLDTSEAKVKAVFEWVRDNIVHSRDAQLGIVDYSDEREDLDEFLDIIPVSASEVLEAGHGICYSQSHLLAGLLRAQKIPVGFCYQVLCKDGPRSGKVLHGLNAVYMDTVSRWVLLDARGNIREKEVEFGYHNEGLAFAMNEVKGELLYPEIYPAPHPTILDTLKRFDSRRVMWPYLPYSL